MGGPNTTDPPLATDLGQVLIASLLK